MELLVPRYFRDSALAAIADAEYHELVIAGAQPKAISIGGTGFQPVNLNDLQDAGPTLGSPSDRRSCGRTHLPSRGAQPCALTSEMIRSRIIGPDLLCLRRPEAVAARLPKTSGRQPVRGTMLV
jgi:hypothetical protein